jgi:hypothetical protein
MNPSIPIKKSPCPNCGTKNDRTAPFGHTSGSPQPGHFTVCFSCGGINIFAEDLSVRKPTPEELDLIPADQMESLKHVQAAIHMVQGVESVLGKPESEKEPEEVTEKKDLGDKVEKAISEAQKVISDLREAMDTDTARRTVSINILSLILETAPDNAKNEEWKFMNAIAADMKATFNKWAHQFADFSNEHDND